MMMNRYALLLIGCLAYGIVAAAPLALACQSREVVLWTGLAAAASYAKGKLEPAPTAAQEVQ